MLAKRLINQLSVSDDYEKLLITKFKVTDRFLLSIYIKKNVCLSVCLSVLYAFGPCDS